MVNKLNLGLVGCFLLVNSEIYGMDFSSKKVALWKRGESMAGEEFIAANESVVDYLATLKRPSEPFKANVYQCQVKYRDTTPSVQNNGGTTIDNGYVFIRTVYDMKDCILAEHSD